MAVVIRPSRTAEFTYLGRRDLGEGIGHGLVAAGKNFGSLIDRLNQEKDLEKQRGRVAKAKRQSLIEEEKHRAIAEKRTPNVDQYSPNNMTDEQVVGAFESGPRIRQMDEQRQRGELIAAQMAHLQAGDARQAQQDEAIRQMWRVLGKGEGMAPGSEAAPPGSPGYDAFATTQPSAVPAPLSNEQYDVKTAPPPTGPNARVLRALAESAVPLGPEHLANFMKAFGVKSGAVPGTVQPVPGRPDYSFGIQGESGAGTFLKNPEPTEEPGEGPLLSKDKQFYYSKRTKDWHHIGGEDMLGQLRDLIQGLNPNAKTTGKTPAPETPRQSPGQPPATQFRQNAEGQIEQLDPVTGKYAPF